MPTGIPQVNPSAVVPGLDYIFPNTKKLQYLFFSERVLNGVFICLLFFCSQFASRVKTIKNCPEVNEVRPNWI